MPLYEYRCEQCDHKFEKIQGYDAPEVMECPVCKGEAVRMISRAAVQFKGTGFYSTDYGAKPGKVAASEQSGDGAAASNAGDGNKGDGKAAASSDTSKAASPAEGSSTSSDGAPSKPASPASTAAPASPSPSSSANKD